MIKRKEKRARTHGLTLKRNSWTSGRAGLSVLGDLCFDDDAPGTASACVTARPAKAVSPAGAGRATLLRRAGRGRFAPAHL
jgi:hypothetical protein